MLKKHHVGMSEYWGTILCNKISLNMLQYCTTDNRIDLTVPNHPFWGVDDFDPYPSHNHSNQPFFLAVSLTSHHGGSCPARPQPRLQHLVRSTCSSISGFGVQDTHLAAVACGDPGHHHLLICDFGFCYTCILDA